MATDDSLRADIESWMVTAIDGVSGHPFKTVDHWREQLPEDPAEIAQAFSSLAPFALCVYEGNEDVVYEGGYEADLRMNFAVVVGVRNQRGNHICRTGDSNDVGIGKCIEAVITGLQKQQPLKNSSVLACNQCELRNVRRVYASDSEFAIYMTFLVSYLTGI